MLNVSVRVAFAASVLGILMSLTAYASEHRVEITRDEWGVPHIQSDTELGAIHGQGYAVAEDRLPTVMRLYRAALGRMAEAFGPEHVDDDYISRLSRHEEVARERFGDIPQEYQDALTAFVAGIRAYMAAHPERVPEYAIDPEPHHPVAAGRHFIWGWPLGQAFDDLSHAPEDGEQDDTGRGSNQWSVSGRRTAGGHPILVFDPHLSWRGSQLLYECHLRGGDLDAYGFGVPGTPYIGLGHNDNIAWAMTTGGPDTADVYELSLNPSNPMQYRYDGEWRSLTRRTIDIAVKTDDGMETVSRPAYASHHGPIGEQRGDKAYAFKLAYADEVDLATQLARMNKAENIGDFLRAMSMAQLMPQNVMYADIHGNTYYQRTGRVPIRPDGYDWTRPVPGDTSESEWLGIHDTADLAQLLNPAAGWMQNCNISPGTMTENSPMTADRYPHYIYMNSTDGANPRGRRANQLLAATTRMTLEDATAIANDHYAHGEGPWRRALARAFDVEPRDELREAVEIIRAWDGYAHRESVGVALFVRWLNALGPARYGFRQEALAAVAPLEAEERATLLDALTDAGDQMREAYGRLDVPWGDVWRARRGDESWPVSGVSGEGGLSTLRAVNGRWEEDGVGYIRAGQLCTTVVMLDPNGVRSYSAVPFGQSEDPESPHYTDQGRLLFAEEKLKDSRYRRDVPDDKVESRILLTYSR